MTEHQLHHIDVGTTRDGEAGSGVAKFVQVNAGEVCPLGLQPLCGEVGIGFPHTTYRQSPESFRAQEGPSLRLTRNADCSL